MLRVAPKHFVPNNTFIVCFVTKLSQYLIGGGGIKSHLKGADSMIKVTELCHQELANKKKCPICDSEIEIPSDITDGEILSCPGCGMELEVKNVSKGGECVELQEFIMEGEDWGE